MSRKSGLVLVVLVALVLGYSAGMERAGSPNGNRPSTGKVSADSTLIKDTQFGSWISSDADGSKLSVWWFLNGSVASARSYRLSDGKIIATDFVPSNYTAQGSAPGK